ncbi:hypothetical protein AB1Y20_005933 [Prymnesium parvum]|uniref:N-acetyltransferase domain-containing protein n=1 Tax=Prymnesium parvum TaxID=97485 RepID=A0AB34J0Z1_PRYPA
MAALLPLCLAFPSWAPAHPSLILPLLPPLACTRPPPRRAPPPLLSTPRPSPAAPRGIAIRRAAFPADFEAVCRVRAPSAFVVEDGTAGFLGRRVSLPPEEALARRVSARLGGALRDNATVLLAVDGEGGVVGTADVVELPAGASRRAFAPPLPRRCLVRNVWVCAEVRRRGVASALMREAEGEARARGAEMVTLEVNWDNAPARRLYERLGYEDLEPSQLPIPFWMRGALLLGKRLS